MPDLLPNLEKVSLVACLVSSRLAVGLTLTLPGSSGIWPIALLSLQFLKHIGLKSNRRPFGVPVKLLLITSSEASTHFPPG